MDGIGATRTSTGQIVEILVDDDGRLCARTPDGTTLQTQTVMARRLKLRGDKLKWSRVEYQVDDEAAAQAFVDSLATPRKPYRRIAVVIGVFALGLALGVVGGVVLRDRARDATCDEAREVVDRSLENMDELNQTETQDRTFFAAVIVEQRAITYTMGTASSCFPLADRAAAEGLLEGIRGLLNSSPG